MPFNGAGNFNSLTPPNYPAVAGDTIRAADYNAVINDLIAGLTNCVTRDGQSPPTSNLPMAGKKHTGVGNAAAADQYAAYGQLTAVNTAILAALPFVNVKAYGATGDGVTDDSAAIALAIATGRPLYFPTGTYRCNVTAAAKIIMFGDGSHLSFIQPFSTTTAAITYTATSPYWTYHSEVRDLCFLGTTKTGVGWTFGKTDPALYAAGDENINNVKFYGVDFRGLEKGIQFPFGNIGTEFYSCGFHSCKYGAYLLNNKWGAAMHAGNKYWYAGEMSGNDCAVYVHNTSADGLGGLFFHNVIFEINAINTYIYTDGAYIPVVFDGCWNELNGTLSGTATFALDQWAGTVLSTTVFNARAHIFDGSDWLAEYRSGRVSDFYIKATNMRVTCNNSLCEREAGVGGINSTVDNSLSQLILVNPLTDYGVAYGPGIIVEGTLRYMNNYTVNSDPGIAGSRYCTVPNRSTKSNFYAPSSATHISINCTTIENFGAGSFATIPGTLVADGLIYPVCNEFSIPFTVTSQFMALLNSTITASAGWYVMTVDLLGISGSPKFYIWDRSTAQAMVGGTITNGTWTTMASIFYSPGGQTFYFDCGGTAVTANFRISAFQMHRFNTQMDAEEFLKSGTYITPSYRGSAVYDPPSLADGTGTTTTVTCTGAALGDQATASFSLNLQGITLTAYVSAANTVSVRFQNESGGVLDLASGTLYVRTERN